MKAEDSPYDPGPCQRCGEPSAVVLKIGEHVVKGEVVPADFPGLATLCWNRSKTAPIDRETAWTLYRANWRFIYQDDLTAEERDLIEGLEAEFGNGEHLLGIDGPPPPFNGPQRKM